MKKVTIMLSLLCVAALAQEKGTFTDTRDGKNYNTVKIGEQTWMAQNLNYKLEKVGARCYNDNEARCDKYGRLYDWATAIALPSNCNSSSCASRVGAKHQGICPNGWHLPNNEELNKYALYVDSYHSNYIDINKKFNFSIILGGSGYFRGYSDSSIVASFGGVGESTGWWNATELSADKAKCQDTNTYENNCEKFRLLSVRCLQD